MLHDKALSVLLLTTFLFRVCQSEVEYSIVPEDFKDVTSCNNCLTLSQFASNTSYYLSNDTTLIIQPGNITLGRILEIKEVQNFILQSDSVSDQVIVCNTSGKLLLENIEKVHIENINFQKCFGTKATQVQSFVLVNTSFIGQVFTAKGTALELIKTSAVISHSLFSQYYHGTYQTTIANIPRNASHVQSTMKFIGAAMIISGSNVTLVNCNFTENRAQLGGAVYAEKSSLITINATYFIFNTAWEQTGGETAAGGALYAVSNCSITINNTSFTNNSVYYGYGLGGAIAVYESSLYVHESTFTNNQADLGGATYVWQSFALFESSNLTNCGSRTIYGSGGLLFAERSSVIFESNTISSNVANNGGFAYVNNSTICIILCNVTENRAYSSGGVISTQFQSTLSLRSCSFTRNSAIHGAVMHIQSIAFSIHVTNCSFQQNHVKSHGAVYYIFQTTREPYPRKSKLTVKCSDFLDNRAGGNGGVLYSRTKTLHYIDTNNAYQHNSAMDGGIMDVMYGVIEMNNSSMIANTASRNGIVKLDQTNARYYSVKFLHNTASTFIVMESQVTFFGNIEFIGNQELNTDTTMSSFTSAKGGAITAVFSTVVFEEYSVITFTKNMACTYGGAIISINSNIRNHGETTLSNNRAKKGAGIYLFQSDLRCTNLLMFIENSANTTGGGIHALNSFIRLTFEGSLLFMRNRADLGGGIFLTTNSKINIQGIPGLNTGTLWGLRIRLINNSASYGGGIYIDDDSNPLSCVARSTRLSGLENECFVQAQSRVIGGNIVKYLFFNLNKASVGSNIYGGLLDRCRSFIDTNSITFDLKYLLQVTNIKAEDILHTVSSQSVRLCFCKFNKMNCSYQPNQIDYVTKGEDFTIQIVAVDQVNNTISANIKAYTQSSESRFGTGQQSQLGFNTCTNLTYSVDSANKVEKLILYPDGPCKNANSSSRYVDIKFLPCHCPVGFMEKDSPTTCECICHNELAPYVASCNSTTSVIVRNSQAWITAILNYKNGSNETITAEGYIVHPYCPYDYCYTPSKLVHIDLSTSDGANALCNFNRVGVLCGACEPGLSILLGSSRCRSCSNSWLALLLPFCLAGIALVVSILLLNLTVSNGTITGFIFFSNIVIANRPIFIPLTEYNFLAMFVSWFSLDLGIETCFANGLTTYGKTWLQFIFPTYIFALIIAIIAISQYSQRFSKVLGGRNPIATFATLIWLSNAKLFRTILSIFSFTQLKYPNGKKTSVWLPDANIDYLRGKHIPLFLFALLVLTVAIVYIVFLLFWQWIVSVPKSKVTRWVRNTKLLAFMDAHHAAFKGKHRYWPGLLLLISMVQYFISAFNVNGNPEVNLYSIIVLVTAINIYRSIVRGVYNKRLQDCLETVIHFNLILFAVSTTYVLDTDGNQTVLVNILLSVLFVTFIGITGYHIVTTTCGKRVKQFFDNLNSRKAAQRYSDYEESLITQDDELLEMNDKSRQDEEPEVKHTSVRYVKTSGELTQNSSVAETY